MVSSLQRTKGQRKYLSLEVGFDFNVYEYQIENIFILVLIWFSIYQTPQNMYKYTKWDRNEMIENRKLEFVYCIYFYVKLGKLKKKCIEMFAMHLQNAIFDNTSLTQYHLIKEWSIPKGNPRRHITTLQSLADKVCHGEPSLQNSLELAHQTLR